MKKIITTFFTLLMFFSANTLFSQTYNQDNDEVDFYVPGILANDAMQSVNFLLCFMKNTNFQTFVDQGVYKALVDEAKCQNASGLDAAAEALNATGSSADATGGAANNATEIDYTTAVFQPVTGTNELLGKGWVSLNFDIGGSDRDITAYVKTNVRESAANSRFGSFTMRYDLRNDSAIPGILANTSIEKGYLDVNNSVVKYRSSGFDYPPRSIEIDISNTDDIQGILQHVVVVNQTDFYSVKHQIHVNETQNLYCQKFLTAHLVTQNQATFVWSEGQEYNNAQFQNIIDNTNDISTDGGSDSTITGTHCWDLRRSLAKRIVYEYGTYQPSGANPNRKVLASPALSLEARASTHANNAGLQKPIWIHASHWGVHVNSIDRANVSPSIVFKNSRNKLDTKEYSLKKNFIEIEKRAKQTVNLNSLDKVSFQTNVSWLKSANSPFQQKMNNLGFPIVGNCNSDSNPANFGFNCPEFSGYISVNPGGTEVTFHVTHAMSWDNANRQLPFEIPNADKFSFTATQWATQMTDNNGWNVGMGFHEPDEHQGYYIPYAAFSDVNSANVVTHIEEKLTLPELLAEPGADNLICLRNCLGVDEINAALAAAFNARETNVNPANPLSVSPYFNVGPYLEYDAYEDNNPNNGTKDNTEPVIFAGENNRTNSVRKINAPKYVVDITNGEYKFRENFNNANIGGNQTGYFEYSQSNLNKLDARTHNDGLRNYRYKVKPDSFTFNNWEENFGWAFEMEIVADTVANDLDCDDVVYPNGIAPQGYDQNLRYLPIHGNGIVMNNIGSGEHYCMEKFENAATKYRIRMKQTPNYVLVDNSTNQPVTITPPETVVFTVPTSQYIDYNFDNTDMAGKKIKLKFEGFGALHRIPGRVVDVCNDLVKGRYVDEWNRCYRFVHEFTIPDGTVLKDTNGNDYLKVRALRGDEYLKKLVANYDSFTKVLTDLPGDENLLDIFTDIGTKPTITFPTNASEDAAVVHGTTVIAP